MGRKERRYLERKNRIEERKGKLLLSRDDISKIRQEESLKTSTFDVEMLMTCFALSEHQVHGFGVKRIQKTLQRLDELAGDILNERITYQEVKEELERTVHLKIEM